MIEINLPERDYRVKISLVRRSLVFSWAHWNIETCFACHAQHSSVSDSFKWKTNDIESGDNLQPTACDRTSTVQQDRKWKALTHHSLWAWLLCGSFQARVNCASFPSLFLFSWWYAKTFAQGFCYCLQEQYTSTITLRSGTPHRMNLWNDAGYAVYNIMRVSMYPQCRWKFILHTILNWIRQ